MNVCTSYDWQTYEILLPSLAIFDTLCVSSDKTNLFLISFLRLMIYVLAYYLIDIKIISYILLFMICICVVYLIAVIFKQPLFVMDSNKSAFAYTHPNPNVIPYSLS